jgi:ubiquinone biosynthesis accessory factor UbiJ
MLKPLLTRLLNHLIQQNSWAKPHLAQFGGKTVRFSIPPVSADLTILEDGGMAVAGESALPDASIILPLPVAMRLLAKDNAAASLASLEGDTELAAALAKILRDLSWDYEEDLSRLIGDIPAHQLAEFGRKAVSEVRSQSLNVAQMASEYLQEEQPMLAKKMRVVQFNQGVDTLREDIERLAKRIEKLSAQVSSQSGTGSSS